MTKLELAQYKISVDQWDPYPSWVCLRIGDGNQEQLTRLTPKDFKLFVAWLKAVDEIQIKLDKP